MSTVEGDRRRGTRHLACFPIQERAADAEPRTAMIRELSVVGAQILTQTKREAGTEISLSLYLEEGHEPRTVDARVVRCERRVDGGVWPYLTIVEFATALTDLASEIAKVAAAQEQVFGPSNARKSGAPPAK